MKKRFIGLLMVGTSLLSLSIGYAASNVHLVVNGQELSADVQMIDGKSYVPLRVVSEALGAKVDWNGDTNTISINNSMQSASQSNQSTQTPVVSDKPVQKDVLTKDQLLKQVKINNGYNGIFGSDPDGYYLRTSYDMTNDLNIDAQNIINIVSLLDSTDQITTVWLDINVAPGEMVTYQVFKYRDPKWTISNIHGGGAPVPVTSNMVNQVFSLERKILANMASSDDLANIKDSLNKEINAN